MNPNRKYKNHKTGKPGKNQFSKARELGLEKPVISLESRLKRSEAAKKQVWTEERRKKLSLSMREAVKRNPESYTSNNVCGRVKIEEYKNKKFHGKWEVLFAKWLDANEIIWEREIESFPYFWSNDWHLYFPDFFIPEYNVFVEIKGYETDRDRSKWSAVSNLIIIRGKEISKIKKDSFKIEDFRALCRSWSPALGS